MNLLFDEIEEECTGCAGCYNACIHKAIEMRFNNYGFLRPNLIKSKCINCNICKEHCPIYNNANNLNNSNPKAYASWSNNKNTQINSSSGGIFFELAKKVVKDKGIVFGAYMNVDYYVKHTYTTTIEEIKKMQGSKYLQSNIGDSYRKAIELSKTKKILFTGTPCQIAALNTYIYKYNIQNIITCEVLCHGIPSQLVFDKYINYLSEKYNSTIKNFEFRNKDNGWKHFNIKANFEDKKVYKIVHKKDPFMIGFLKNIYLKPSCYNCKFNKLPRIADITLGDCWEVDKNLYNPYGTSFIFTNTQKGENLITEISTEITLKQVNINDVIKYNPRITSGHYNQNLKYKNFYNELNNYTFKYLYTKYLKPENLFNKIIRKIERYFK